jgi:hypothetical protein
LVGKPDGKTLGGTKSRWEGDIKMDIKIGCDVYGLDSTVSV